MPKKTKRAKLIAEYRRKLHGLEQPSGNTSPIQETTNSMSSAPIYSLHGTQPVTVPVSAIRIQTDEFTAIRKDLIKTLIIVAVFLCIEIAIWRFLT